MSVRRFTDSEGIVWDVWETTPSKPTFVSPAFSRGWLTFSSPTMRRRLVPVPQRWETDPEERLELYCRSAEAVDGKR